jgi:hypothetical protein
MNQLQTVLYALSLAERTSYSESNQDKFIEAIAIVKQMMHTEPVAWRSQLASGSYTYCNTPEYFDNAEPIYVSPVAPQAVQVHVDLQRPMPFVPWSKESEMMESWTHEPQPVKPIAQRVSDLVERLGGIEYLESRSSKPVQNPLTYEQIQQLYIKAYNGGDHGRDFETAFVKEIEAAHGITGIRE